MSDELCAVKDCEAPPTHRAEIVIYAAVSYLHPPAIGAIGVRVCDAHADDKHARALLTDEGKRRLEAEFAKARRARPDWTRSYVRWVKL